MLLLSCAAVLRRAAPLCSASPRPLSRHLHALHAPPPTLPPPRPPSTQAVFDVDHDEERAAAVGMEVNGFSFEGMDAAGMDYALNRRERRPCCRLNLLLCGLMSKRCDGPGAAAGRCRRAPEASSPRCPPSSRALPLARNAHSHARPTSFAARPQGPVPLVWRARVVEPAEQAGDAGAPATPAARPALRPLPCVRCRGAAAAGRIPGASRPTSPRSPPCPTMQCNGMQCNRWTGAGAALRRTTWSFTTKPLSADERAVHAATTAAAPPRWRAIPRCGRRRAGLPVSRTPSVSPNIAHLLCPSLAPSPLPFHLVPPPSSCL